MRKSFTYNGKRYYVSANTKKELNKKISEKKKSLKSSKEKSYTFKEWTEEFLEVYKTDISYETLQNYKYRIQGFLFPIFGDKKLDEIKSIDCQKAFNKMKGYSSDYIKKTYHDLHQILEKAVKNKLIEENVCEYIELPKGDKKKRRSITQKEREVIHTVAKYHSHGLYFLIMLYCGLRPHETALVQGKDIKDNILHIRGTKTEDADRYVPIPNILLKMIPKIEEDEYLFKSISGIYPLKKRHRETIWRSFSEECEKYIDVTFTPYCLRHTYCTDLQDAGVPITVAKSLMGHSTIKLTADVYTHVSEYTMDESMQKINAHFNAHKYANENSVSK